MCQKPAQEPETLALIGQPDFGDDSAFLMPCTKIAFLVSFMLMMIGRFTQEVDGMRASIADTFL